MLIWPIWGWLPWGRCIPFFYDLYLPTTRRGWII